MADYPDTDAGRQAARDAGNWVGRDESGNLVIEPGHPGGQAGTGDSGGGGAGDGGGGGSSGGGGGGYYQTKNGLQTLQSMEQQLRSVGWQGGEPVATAYARTTGAPVAPAGGGGGGTSGGGGGGAGPVGQDASMDALRNFFGQTAGFSREELAEKARQFNENLAFIERQWERDGKPRLEIDRDIQALRRQEVESQIGLATRAQGLAEELGRGRLGIETRAQSLAEELGRGRLGLDQGTLGLNYLTTASQMGGPADYFQSVDFLRGARQRGDVPTFLDALRQNTQLPGFSGAGLTPPEAQTAAGLQAKLTGGSPITGYNPDQALAAIGSIFQRGATGLTPGSLERLDVNELDLLKSGGRKLGYDSDAWLRAYGRAGVGQQAAAPF